MKVIRNGTGWDIAFDMVFTDKGTAAIIAQRIAPLLSTLIRDAVDSSMCRQLVAAEDRREDRRDDRREHTREHTQEDLSAAAPALRDQDLHTPSRLKQQRPVDVAPAVYATHSIASRVRAMGL
jgi:hypothetical protein